MVQQLVSEVSYGDGARKPYIADQILSISLENFQLPSIPSKFLNFPLYHLFKISMLSIPVMPPSCRRFERVFRTGPQNQRYGAYSMNVKVVQSCYSNVPAVWENYGEKGSVCIGHGGQHHEQASRDHFRVMPSSVHLVSVLALPLRVYLCNSCRRSGAEPEINHAEGQEWNFTDKGGIQFFLLNYMVKNCAQPWSTQSIGRARPLLAASPPPVSAPTGGLYVCCCVS